MGSDTGQRILDPNNGQSVSEAVALSLKSAGAAHKGFFARFSAGQAKRGGEPQSPTSTLQYEIGIRPSFYWLDADLTAAERKQQEEMARRLKSDCQDQAVVIEDFAGRRGAYFAGVFDGHGPDGRGCAKFASSMLPQLLAKDPKIWSEDMKKCYKAFKNACYSTNDALQKPSMSGVNATLSGTTACFAIVADKSVCVGSTGDSRCIVVRRSLDGRISSEQLSWDAKPDVPEERRRIRAKNGIVAQLQDPSGQAVGAFRVFRRPGDLLPGLAMSRSLGDALAHSLGVVAKPAFKVYHVQPDDVCLVLGTDGVFDVMDNQRVGEFVCHYLDRRDPALTAADMLTLEAQEQWKTMGDDIIVDDAGAVVLYLKPMPEPRYPPAPIQVPIAKAAYSCDAANHMYTLYVQNPQVDPRHSARVA